MILADWIVNNECLLSKCSDYSILIESKKKKSVELITYLVHELKEKKKLELDIPLKMTVHLYPHALGKAFLHDEEIYILFYNKETQKNELDEFLEKLFLQREEIKERIKGLAIGWLDDTIGPIPVFHSVDISEISLNMLVSISMTIVGGGSNYREGLYGPIPVPNNSDLEVIFYSHLIPAPNSEDERIARNGRPIIFFIFFKTGEIFAHSASMHIFLNQFFKKILPFEFNDTSYATLLANLRSLFINTLDPELTELDFRSNLAGTLYEYHQRIDELKAENEKLLIINTDLKNC